MEKKYEELEKLTKLLMLHSKIVAEWAAKHSPDDRIFSGAISSIQTIRDLEEHFNPKVPEPPKKYDPIKMF